MSKKKEKSVLGMGFKNLFDEKENGASIFEESLEEELEIAQATDILEKDTGGGAASESDTESESATESESDTASESGAASQIVESPEQVEQKPDDPVSDNTSEDEVRTESVSANTTTVVVEDIELLQLFVQESQDHLENIEDKILKLEATHDPDTTNEIFRCMHTMKGSSSFLGLKKIQELSHDLESILDQLRSNDISISQEVVDILLEGTDVLCKMMADLSRVAHENAGAKGKVEISDSEIEITPILARIGQICGPPKESDSSVDPTAVKEETNGTKGLITDEMQDKFLSESRDLLDRVEKDILELEQKPNDKTILNNAFRDIHTIKGNAGFLGYNVLEKMCMDLESLLDSIRDGEKRASPQITTTILKKLDLMHQSMQSLLDKEVVAEPGGAIGSSAGAEEEPGADRPIGEILVDMGEATPEVIDQALDIQARKLGEILVDEAMVSKTAVDKALDSQGKVAAADRVGVRPLERKDIRVDMGKLDKLFDLMGELITAEAMVLHNPELESLDLEGFAKAGNYLAKITREMQEITMSVRMIPLEGLFNKMRRLVRDLSKKFGKSINLVVRGQETEMDRNVIEQISDPMVHIIRNAIDHGIEAEDVRKKKGKDKKGTVSLGASYEGAEIWITVKDDGAGLDRKKILQKAEEKGLLTGDPASMEDGELWQLLFAPGFSTAEMVSEVSGRGVGMDVVKRNIEKLRGKIDIKSSPDEGTEISLKIPLTLAIMDGIIARVGNSLFALPLGDILEFHKATQSQITKSDTRREVLRLREEIIPVIKLHEFFMTATDKTDICEGIVIIVQTNDRKAGFLVDDIMGYQQIVVKALPEFLGDMKAISGCSILGNGEVSLIIDTGSFLKGELE